MQTEEHPFREQLVNKEYSQKKTISALPRFLSEYLVSQHVDEKGVLTQEAYGEILKFIASHRPERKDKEYIKHLIMEQGVKEILDEVSVDSDVKHRTYNAHIPVLGLSDVRVRMEVLRDNENLLKGGMWGMAQIRWAKDVNPELPNRPRNLLLDRFVPFQVSRCDLGTYLEKRSRIPCEDWLDLLVNTIGLNPSMYPTRRSRIIMLSRLVPVVEPNVSMIELGPKGTGKTHCLRNVSYYVRILSGSRVTPAVLFYNARSRSPGILASRDTVVFDEISITKFSDAAEIVGKLKDYMESGFFDRGTEQIQSSASVVLLGNLPTESGRPSSDAFFDVLPKHIRDSAFIDRIHGLIPGWEIPRIQRSEVHLSRGFGLRSDYFAEILHRLRPLDYRPWLTEKVKFWDTTSIRDERGILKIASGLLKLIYPGLEKPICSDEELEQVMDVALEYRQEVVNQLALMDPEFESKGLRYEVV